MNQKVIISCLIATVWLTLGCQTINNLIAIDDSTATPTLVLEDKPVSTFVPPRNVLLTRVNHPVQIDSRHLNDRPLATLEVSINGQPDFPAALAIVQFTAGDQMLPATSLTPELPTSDWTVPLTWTGRTPGVYDLTLKVSDVDGRQGDPIVQRIEVR